MGQKRPGLLQKPYLKSLYPIKSDDSLSVMNLFHSVTRSIIGIKFDDGLNLHALLDDIYGQPEDA
jgi:hypothetical protein